MILRKLLIFLNLGSSFVKGNFSLMSFLKKSLNETMYRKKIAEVLEGDACIKTEGRPPQNMPK